MRSCLAFLDYLATCFENLIESSGSRMLPTSHQSRMSSNSSLQSFKELQKDTTASRYSLFVSKEMFSFQKDGPISTASGREKVEETA